MTTDSTEKVLVIPTWRFRQYAKFKRENKDVSQLTKLPYGDTSGFYSPTRPCTFPNQSTNNSGLLTRISTQSDFYNDLGPFRNCYEFRPRNEVETDETWIQLIPYFTIDLTIPEQKAIPCENMEHYQYRPKTRKILSYTRSAKSGESRLHNKRSIGFGGHVNDLDHAYATKSSYYPEIVFCETIRQGLNRELSEELSVDWNHCACSSMRYSGLIYDPTTDVGKVHLGVVFELSFNTSGNLGLAFDQYIKLNDNSNKDHLWIPYDDRYMRVTAEENNYEIWSILAVGLT
jgi:predicted NUDIX family phosphoesterase